jgi:hypothetical protein
VSARVETLEDRTLLTTVTGTGGNDTLVVSWNGSQYQYSLNGGAPVLINSAQPFTFAATNDTSATFEIMNQTGSEFAPTGGIFFNANPSSPNNLQDLGGTAAGAITETNGATPGSGSISDGTQDISFTGVDPVFISMSSPELILSAAISNSTINFVEGARRRTASSTTARAPTTPSAWPRPELLP